MKQWHTDQNDIQRSLTVFTILLLVTSWGLAAFWPLSSKRKCCFFKINSLSTLKCDQVGFCSLKLKKHHTPLRSLKKLPLKAPTHCYLYQKCFLLLLCLDSCLLGTISEEFGTWHLQDLGTEDTLGNTIHTSVFQKWNVWPNFSK